MSDYATLYQALEEVMAKKDRVCIAIDGRCASGKTTLAGLLAERYDAVIVHCDDFFLPPQLRTYERLSQPGGNIHYERFMDEIIPGIKSGVAFSYRRFDCSIMDYNGLIHILPKPLMIIEGAYSLRHEFREIYDLKIFRSISRDEQIKRIKQRNGEKAYNDFESRWIPMEEDYIKACDIIATADIYLES